MAGVRTRTERVGILRGAGGLLCAVGLFSAAVNLLALTGPLFMMQVYDRVLPARSGETLTTLFLFAAGLFAAMGLLDAVRMRIMARIGARMRARMDPAVLDATIGDRPSGGQALRGLDSVSALISAPVFLALFDLPWSPLFFAAIFVFHPWLGWLAVAGAGVMAGAALLNQRLSSPAAWHAGRMQAAAVGMAERARSDRATIRALGLRPGLMRRWRDARLSSSRAGMVAADRSGAFLAFSRAFRLFLQTAMLALGAFVVLDGGMTAGAMIAASVLFGRALAPIEQIVGGWTAFRLGQEGWRALQSLPAETAPPTALPPPRACLEADSLTLDLPGRTRPVLQGVSFRLDPGQALGIIGPSGAGKSTLIRAICGLHAPTGGEIRLDGATPAQYGTAVFSRLIGYLPQQTRLFDGTVAENIARLDVAAPAGRIVAAARRAGVHRMVLGLPSGYETRVDMSGGPLSGGQIQRLGLARALYGDPVLLLLDEPEAHLDGEGRAALHAVVRGVKAAGGAVIITAHRASALAECDLLLVLENGQMRDFGPRDAVLRAVGSRPARLRTEAGS